MANIEIADDLILKAKKSELFSANSCTFLSYEFMKRFLNVPEKPKSMRVVKGYQLVVSLED